MQHLRWKNQALACLKNPSLRGHWIGLPLIRLCAFHTAPYPVNNLPINCHSIVLFLWAAQVTLTYKHYLLIPLLPFPQSLPLFSLITLMYSPVSFLFYLTFIIASYLPLLNFPSSLPALLLPVSHILPTHFQCMHVRNACSQSEEKWVRWSWRYCSCSYLPIMLFTFTLRGDVGCLWVPFILPEA